MRVLTERQSWMSLSRLVELTYSDRSPMRTHAISCHRMVAMCCSTSLLPTNESFFNAFSSYFCSFKSSDGTCTFSRFNTASYHGTCGIVPLRVTKSVHWKIRCDCQTLFVWMQIKMSEPSKNVSNSFFVWAFLDWPIRAEKQFSNKNMNREYSTLPNPNIKWFAAHISPFCVFRYSNILLVSVHREFQE